MRVLSLDLKVETDLQFNTAGGSEFQVRGAAVLNDRLANDVRRNVKQKNNSQEEGSYADPPHRFWGVIQGSRPLPGWELEPPSPTSRHSQKYCFGFETLCAISAACLTILRFCCWLDLAGSCFPKCNHILISVANDGTLPLSVMYTGWPKK